MPDKDDYRLKYIKNDFNVNLRNPTYRPSYNEGKKILEDLARQGYDPEDAATYELLEPGLTRATFNELAHVADTYFITSQFYYAMQRQRTDYTGQEATIKYGATGELIRRLDFTLAEIKAKPLPADTDPYHKHILGFIIDEYESGRMQDYHKDLAVPYLVEALDLLQHQWDAAKKLEAEGKGDWHALSQRLNEIQKIRDVAGGMTPPRRDAFLQQANTNGAALEAMQREIAVTFARTTIAKNPVIPIYEPIHLAYQKALEALDGAGFDLNAPSTYAAIGMDRQTFWGNYHRQIEWNKTDGKVYGLPKKIYSPAP